MFLRTTVSKVAFRDAFSIRGYTDVFPAGSYEIVAEDELLQGLSFEAWRRSATHLVLHSGAGRTEMRPVEQSDLDDALSRDRALEQKSDKCEAAQLPLEEST